MECWEDCGGDEERLPFGPWGQNEHERLMGERGRDTVYTVIPAMRPVLPLEGSPPDVVDF
ncbi:hypothetical protein FRB94_002179 [Tulasnella sp. JGI-2019a]|nr:hypothetical protein FRB94_002179 [Tulasnella sp. JGI-2019a]